MGEAWETRSSPEKRASRHNKKTWRGDSNGRTLTPTPVPTVSRVKIPVGGSSLVYVQPDDPIDTDGPQEIGTLWFDTDEPVP